MISFSDIFIFTKSQVNEPLLRDGWLMRRKDAMQGFEEFASTAEAS